MDKQQKQQARDEEKLQNAISHRLDNIEAFADKQEQLYSMLKCFVDFRLLIETPDGNLLFEGEWFVKPKREFNIFCPEKRELGVSTGKTMEEALLDLRSRLLERFPKATQGRKR